MQQRVRAVGGEQRRGVGADGEEGDEAEIEQARQADLQIQPHAHQDVEPDQHQHLADIGAGHRRQQHQDEQCEPGPDHALAPMVARRDARGAPAPGSEPSTSLRHRDDDEDRDGALRAQALPGVEEVAEVADRSLVLLQHELDQFLEHAGDTTAIAPGNDRAAHHARG